jgi:class 3 adenylate cyclase
VGGKMHLVTLLAETILTIRNRIRSFTIPERMRTGLFRGFVFSLLLASAAPAVNALYDPERYIAYQDRLIVFFNKLAGQAGPVPFSHFRGSTGVRIDALTKLISCGFVLVLLWKARQRRPVRAMILLVAFLSVAADPPLAGFLQSQSSTSLTPTLWAVELVHPFIVAALLRFAVLFPRPLTTTELLVHLSRSHPGMLRRAWRNVKTVIRRRLAGTGFLQVCLPDAASVAAVTRAGTARGSRQPSIGWFDAAIVLVLATFLFLTRLTDWDRSRDYQVVATSALIVVTRLIATVWKLWIRKGPREQSSRQSLAGPLLIAVYALALATQPKWMSARPVELVILVVTIAFLTWTLWRRLRSYLLSDLQLGLTRPFPVWSAALVAYVVLLGSLLSLTSMNISVVPAWQVGVVVVAAMIGGLVFFLITVGLLLLAFKFLRIGYELGDASDRKRVLWIVEGVAIAAAIQALSGAAWVILHGAIPPEVIEYGSRLVQSVNLPVILLSFGVAVFYYGALDPGLIIRQTTLYTAQFVLSVFVFEGVENLLSWIVSLLLETRELPTWFLSTIAAGIAALVFMRIRRLCAPLVARYLPIVFSGVIERAEPTRRTAVILVTDLVGYTATTLDDERGASALVSLLRQVVKEVVAAGDGRVIECSRDLAILEFPDAVSAVTACRRLFEQFHKVCDSRGLSHARLRASVHAGDLLIAADGGVTGRAVTIANRLRERASAGEILLSQTAMAGLPLILRSAVENLGPTTLRDVPEPQECFRLRVL